MLLLCTQPAFSQSGYLIAGKVTEMESNKPIPNATVHLAGSSISTLSKVDGSFRIFTEKWIDSLEITCIGYTPITLALTTSNLSSLMIKLPAKVEELKAVVVNTAKKPGKSFMQRVIEQKGHNNPSRFRSYSYQRYTRNELDIDNIDYSKANTRGYKGLLLKTYGELDSNAIAEKELPIYFDETIANVYHSTSPRINQENIIARKKLGLKTDQVLSKLDKFYFHFNVYDDWIPIFDQTYVSPLNSNAFAYYDFYEGDATYQDGDTIQEIRFTPKREYERAFTGFLQISKATLAVTSVIMHLSKTANMNFIRNITYSEDYNQVFDSATDRMVYMPLKYISEVKFESGLDLLGIPVPENNTSVKFLFRNTTVTTKLNLNIEAPTAVVANLVRKEKTANWDKTDEYWIKNRSDSLTEHEKNIYKMVDSLKENHRFRRDAKLLAFAGSGVWDFGKYLRLGPYSSFLSKNQLEGYRIRVGFWTMQGISKKASLFGYGAYGTRDQKFKGMIGVKYIWDPARWTKSTLSYGSDYDFMVEQDDELDKDNLINSMFRKNIPFTRMHIRKLQLKHEQYISPSWSARALLNYKELDPVFDFKYRPINPAIDKPYDSVFATMLPVAEASVKIRYSKDEKFIIENYDRTPRPSFHPIISFEYTYGFEFKKAEFGFQKISASIEQRLPLPPKCMLYYKLETGKTFGTLPYILLDVPAGNEYYVSSKYQFNTMAPYEFATDRYVSLHTRFYLGGALLDKIPFLRKLGWRERFSFNSYWGDMTKANIDYNKGSNFNLMGNIPFMEASAGIENIFHLLSVEYYRRLSYLKNPYARKDGIYVGVTLVL